VIAEPAVVQPREADRRASRCVEVALLAVAAECRLEMTPALVEVVGHECGTRRLLVLVGRHPLIVLLALLVP
jgi:hypothetical protein